MVLYHTCDQHISIPLQWHSTIFIVDKAECGLLQQSLFYTIVRSKDTYICPIRNDTFVEFCRSHKNETFCIKSYLGSVRLYTMIFPSHNIQFY